MRIFLDTNVLVSAFVARGMCADLLQLVLAEHDLLTGEVNVIELGQVLEGKFRASPEQVQGAQQLLRDQIVVPRPPTPSALSIRDPDDAWVLASAEAGQAALLVTGDEDLLVVAPLAALRIVSPRDAWLILRGHQP